MHTKGAPLENSNVTAKVKHIGTQVESFLLSLCADHQITQDLLPETTQKGLLNILQLSQDIRIFCLRWRQPPQIGCTAMMILTTEGRRWIGTVIIQEHNGVSNIRLGVKTNNGQVLAGLSKGQPYRREKQLMYGIANQA